MSAQQRDPYFEPKIDKRDVPVADRKTATIARRVAANDNHPYKVKRPAAVPYLRVVTAQPARLPTPHDGPSTGWIAERATKGDAWDGRADSAGEDWPLLKALRADGLTRLMGASVRYREVESAATSENPLRGTSVAGEPYRLDQRTWVDRDGEIRFKGPRALAGKPTEPLPGQHNGSAVEEPWNGDAGLIAKIDAQPILARLRRELGPLVQPVEDAVLHGMTLEEIGRKESFRNKPQACAAGKALVLRGLGMLAGVLEEIDREGRLNQKPPAVRDI